MLTKSELKISSKDKLSPLKKQSVTLKPTVSGMLVFHNHTYVRSYVYVCRFLLLNNYMVPYIVIWW